MSTSTPALPPSLPMGLVNRRIDELLRGRSAQQVNLAASAIEALWHDNPRDSGVRRTFYALRHWVESNYRLTMPPMVDPPEAAWEDDGHEFWSTDPLVQWQSDFDALRRELGGWAAAHFHTYHSQQARGVDQ